MVTGSTPSPQPLRGSSPQAVEPFLVMPKRPTRAIRATRQFSCPANSPPGQSRTPSFKRGRVYACLTASAGLISNAPKGYKGLKGYKAIWLPCKLPSGTLCHLHLKEGRSSFPFRPFCLFRPFCPFSLLRERLSFFKYFYCLQHCGVTEVYEFYVFTHSKQLVDCVGVE